MSRTIRRDFKGRPARDGAWTYKCADGHRCGYCGPGAIAASMDREARRVAMQQVAEAYQ